MKYGVAEMFYSIQGEGANAGRAALFVRLAGCCVGRAPTTPELFQFAPQEKHTICTTGDGTKFVCDTDYTKWKDFTEEDIIRELNALSHRCKLVFITGGEPFLWDLFPLVERLYAQGYEIWVETSGTREAAPWITDAARLVISPKSGYLDSMIRRADHLKFLVTAETSMDLDPIAWHGKPIYLQPIADASVEQSAANLERAMELVRENPHVRLSVQLHKYLAVP